MFFSIGVDVPPRDGAWIAVRSRLQMRRRHCDGVRVLHRLLWVALVDAREGRWLVDAARDYRRIVTFVAGGTATRGRISGCIRVSEESLAVPDTPS